MENFVQGRDSRNTRKEKEFCHGTVPYTWDL